MKELEKEFRGRGEVKRHTFKQLEQSELAYLYEVISDENATHYETFRRKENKQFNCISYPKSTSFGVWAFTYKDYENALQKFNELSIVKTETV